jgi:hypothetical protein
MATGHQIRALITETASGKLRRRIPREGVPVRGPPPPGG